MDFLSNPANAEVLYEEYAARREFSEMQEKTNKEMEARYNAERGITTEATRAADALGKFTDAMINAAPGFKLAAAVYSASAAGGPGPGTSGSSGGGGGGGGGVSVYVDGASVAAAIEWRGERKQMAGGAFNRGGTL
jgi:hypothetical protein